MQLRLDDVNPEYAAFVDKFKPKLTTDDCYTPENIYRVVLDYCVERYGIDPAKVVRPFWPGGDYERAEYPDGCCVVDNPPFSIITQILKHYNARGIRYFLFCPYLTGGGLAQYATLVVAAKEVTYTNGAKVPTSFVTSLEPGVCMRSDARLAERIRQADADNTRGRQLPKYTYPLNVVTASDLGYLSVHGTDWTLLRKDAYFIRTLDAQRASGKALFGAGFLISERAAAERAVAERAAADNMRDAARQRALNQVADISDDGRIIWPLSDREKAIIKAMEADNNGNNDRRG